jgi:hypothetical protein
MGSRKKNWEQKKKLGTEKNWVWKNIYISELISDSHKYAPVAYVTMNRIV